MGNNDPFLCASSYVMHIRVRITTYKTSPAQVLANVKGGGWSTRQARHGSSTDVQHGGYDDDGLRKLGRECYRSASGTLAVLLEPTASDKKECKSGALPHQHSLSWLRLRDTESVTLPTHPFKPDQGIRPFAGLQFQPAPVEHHCKGRPGVGTTDASCEYLHKCMHVIRSTVNSVSLAITGFHSDCYRWYHRNPRPSLCPPDQLAYLSTEQGGGRGEKEWQSRLRKQHPGDGQGTTNTTGTKPPQTARNANASPSGRGLPNGPHLYLSCRHP
ncbi:hypothetical protein LX36DRAFT_662920 [Colletotrichum falcatum]|nr:hypothetical protein LX36DRAFT_662920 [Colletotrichum falcatum]